MIYNVGGFFEDVDKWENMSKFLELSFWSNRNVNLCVMYGITLFLILPLCLVKDVSKLRMALYMHTSKWSKY